MNCPWCDRPKSLGQVFPTFRGRPDVFIPDGASVEFICRDCHTRWHYMTPLRRWWWGVLRRWGRRARHARDH